jgi:hypothetical protein
MGKRIVSFSVYGDDFVYSSGAIANAIAVRQFFPGWIARFYIEDILVDSLRGRLEELGAEVVVMKRKGAVDGTFWRFLPAGEIGLDAVIVRDVDALLCPRNQFVVDEWLLSKKDFHIIRDHPSQRSLILGGLWGARGGVLRHIASLISKFQDASVDDVWGADQRFLARCVYPLVAENSFIHSDFIAFGDEVVHPIVARRLNSMWLGFPPARGKTTEARLRAFRALSDQGLQRLKYSEGMNG